MESYKICGPGLVSKVGDLRGMMDSGKLGANDWRSNGDPFKMNDDQLCKTLH